MIHSVIRFARPGLADDDATRERNMNRFAGYNCASWLMRSIQGVDGLQTRGEPVPEDWGWAVVVDVGPDTFVLGCAGDEDAADHWHVMLGDNVIRGILPSTRRRRTQTLQTLTERVDAFLRAHPDVSNISADV